MDYKKQLEQWFAENEETIVTFLQQLLRIPSVTGEEGPIQAFIAEELKKMQLEVDVFEPSLEELRAHPGFVEVSGSYEGRP
ncbi:MAG TPA: acetylornithine deacetylase, partial [Clostridia bacterium]|nr:acetylornithine deacetylase [Clostridia bacterium]